MRNSFKGNFCQSLADENGNHAFVQKPFEFRVNRRAPTLCKRNDVRWRYFGFLVRCH